MKTILSIDGGGMKGYIPCSVLVELERRMGKPCYEIFDMVAGTSVGGILACIIASGQSTSEALKFFTEDGPTIFGHVQPFGTAGLIKPRYAAAPIENCLRNRLGTTTLNQCKIPLLVTAFDLKAYEPFFFKSSSGDATPLWMVSRATSAAQTYFPGYKIGDKILWDGGNVANNPALCAAAEAIRTWGEGEPLRILSLGCGAAKSAFDAERLIDDGLMHVGIETMSLLLDANDELPDYILKQVLSPSDAYFRIQPKTTRNLTLNGADAKAMADLKAEAVKCVADSASILDAFSAFSPAQNSQV